MQLDARPEGKVARAKPVKSRKRGDSRVYPNCTMNVVVSPGTLLA